MPRGFHYTSENQIANAREEVHRGNEALRAAEELLQLALCNDAVSRAYYAAYHWARAVLFTQGLESKTHRGVVQLVALRFVREGLAYMMQHFAIDALNEYLTEEIPETNRPVVNPARRELDRQYRSASSKLTRCLSRFAALTLHPQSEEPEIEKWERQKADLQEQIDQLEHEVSALKDRRSETPKHLAWEDLPSSSSVLLPAAND